ncbi:MAG: phytanoyl-CoA dioxygenase family protein [Lentisphaeria bacterium]|nr:phytanoyl-CoA dioxygenase family protein [Lentisphaeria bacterium]NQZ68837.1 phytanoyl-CoA dioxygenase family protein [Lentisphaeria bacterium]
MVQLSNEQIRDYNEDGFFFYRDPVFSPERFTALKAMADSCYARGNIQEDGHPPQLIDCAHWKYPEMFDWVFADELLDIVEPIIGPDIALFACHFLRKLPGVGRRVPWHEDSAYWQKLMNPMEVCTVMVALEPCTSDNGCMQVIPGSHKNGYSEYDPLVEEGEKVFNNEIRQDQFDAETAVDLILEPNEASVHHVKIIHNSKANTGTQTRMSFALRFFPTHVKFTEPEGKGEFPVFLARGKDKAGNSYGDPGKSYTPRRQDLI